MVKTAQILAGTTNSRLGNRQPNLHFKAGPRVLSARHRPMFVSPAVRAIAHAGADAGLRIVHGGTAAQASPTCGDSMRDYVEAEADGVLPLRRMSTPNGARRRSGPLPRATRGDWLSNPITVNGP